MPPLPFFAVNQVIFNQISPIFSTMFTKFRIPLGEADQLSYTNLSHHDTISFLCKIEENIQYYTDL
jgi:hypothetical protein